MSGIEGYYPGLPNGLNPDDIDRRLPKNITPERNGAKEIRPEDGYLGPPKATVGDMRIRSPLDSDSDDTPISSDSGKQSADKMEQRTQPDDVRRDPFIKRDLLTKLELSVNDFMEAIEQKYAATDLDIRGTFVEFLKQKVEQLRLDPNNPLQSHQDLDQLLHDVTRSIGEVIDDRHNFLNHFGQTQHRVKHSLASVEQTPLEPEQESKHLQQIENDVVGTRGLIAQCEKMAREVYKTIPGQLKKLRQFHSSDIIFQQFVNDVLVVYRLSFKNAEASYLALDTELKHLMRDIGELIDQIQALESN